jgi:uncharacterized RDD family membrane protein YckC
MSAPADPARLAPGVELAPLGRRLGALLMDWLLAVVATWIFVDPRGSYVPIAVLIGLYAGGVGFFAQTPGMVATRLRCMSVVDGAPVGPLRAILRALLLCLVIPAVVMDDQRRGLHDRAAGTVVVLLPPKAPA